jgi:N-acetylglucosaminyl-diphospho-decaprenol L-rhamnosyltransferase
MTEKNLTIVILTFNSAAIIERSLKNLNADKYKIVIVDNASKDNTVEVIRKNFPQLELIQIPKNIGYGRGNNVALKQVNTEFALVLNPDAFISENDIEVVLSEMKAHSNIAIAGPLILQQDTISQEEREKEIIKIENDFAGLKDMYYEKIGNSFDSRFISGACIFFRMSIFQKLGFFDENIFMFYEDDEICLRSKRNGYKNITVPQATVCHVGASSSKKSLRTTYRRNWHLKGWAKLYWKEMRQGKLRAKKSAFRLASVYFVKFLISLLTIKSEKIAENFGAFMGSISYMIGFGAFKKNGTGRG